MRPLETFISSIPFFAKANLAAVNLQELEVRLDESRDMHSPDVTVDVPEQFTAINFEDVMFSYTDQEGRQLFSVEAQSDEARERLANLLAERPPETEETSLKFFNLPP